MMSCNNSKKYHAILRLVAFIITLRAEIEKLCFKRQKNCNFTVDGKTGAFVDSDFLRYRNNHRLNDVNMERHYGTKLTY